MVHTPLIGRALSKVGLTVRRQPNDRWYAGVLVANLAVFSHVAQVVNILKMLLRDYASVKPDELTTSFSVPKLRPKAASDTYDFLESFYPHFDPLMRKVLSDYDSANGSFSSVALDAVLDAETANGISVPLKISDAETKTQA
jgi:hypothetical protein